MRRIAKWLTMLLVVVMMMQGACPAARAAQDDWAIYLYLCGTDLETRSDAATADLVELVDSRMPDGVTVVIQTGGAKQWRNNIVDSECLERYMLRGDQFARIWRGDARSMGAGETLTDFLAFCHGNFPARHEALILWDHGGGSASGLVMDERFGYDRLSLPELRDAVGRVYAPNAAHPPLELVGFDCCLMATIDTAAAMQHIARYMVASEETEPGSGWNYSGILGFMRRYPGMSGAALGQAICETYMAGCRKSRVDGSATLSVVDLTKLEPLLQAYDRFGGTAVLRACDDPTFFAEFGRGAKQAENYGGNTPSTGYSNMVDLGDLARNLRASMPEASKAVLTALEGCVVHKVNGSYRTRASGLSCYYAFDADEKHYARYAEANPSENFDAFHKYMLTGALDDDARAHIIEDLGYGGEIETLETLNDFGSSGWRTEIDDEGYAVLTLDADTLATVSEVAFQLAWYDEKMDALIYLGSDSDIDQDWKRGVFKDNFRGVWGAIDGCLCHMEILDQGEDYNLYNVPILLNDEPYQLRVAYDFDSETYYMLGALRGLDALGMADREMVRLRVGDVITPVHYIFSASGNDEMEPFVMDDIVVTRRTSFEEVDLGDGEFYLVFTLIDGRGEQTYADEVRITVEGDDMTPEVIG